MAIYSFQVHANPQGGFEGTETTNVQCPIEGLEAIEGMQTSNEITYKTTKSVEASVYQMETSMKLTMVHIKGRGGCGKRNFMYKRTAVSQKRHRERFPNSAQG